MGGEDHGAFLDLTQARKPVVLVDQLDTLPLQIVGRVGVVDEHAEHMDRAGGLFPYAFRNAEGVHHAVAVATWRDLQDLHLVFESTRVR